MICLLVIHFILGFPKIKWIFCVLMSQKEVDARAISAVTKYFTFRSHWWSRGRNSPDLDIEKRSKKKELTSDKKTFILYIDIHQCRRG